MSRITPNKEEVRHYRRILRFPMAKLVIEIFKHEGFIRQRVNELRNDVPKSDRMAIPGHAFISNPTENQAIRNVTPINKIQCDDGFVVRHPEEWIKVIDGVYDFCRDEDTLNILKAWLKGHSAIRISMDLGISRTTVYDVRVALQNYAVALAAQFGLIDITVKGAKK